MKEEEAWKEKRRDDEWHKEKEIKTRERSEKRDAKKTEHGITVYRNTQNKRRGTDPA